MKLPSGMTTDILPYSPYVIRQGWKHATSECGRIKHRVNEAPKLEQKFT